MKAYRVNEFGRPAVVQEFPTPTAQPGEVLVKVKAASVNPVDGAVVAGYMAGYGFTAPLTPGADYSGEVAAVGEGVSHVAVGDQVYGMSPTYSTFAEYVAVKANGVARKPKSVDHATAAAVPLTGLTAWQTLFQLGKLEAGDRILIHGAGGGIGTLAVQLAKDAGATVIAHDRGDKEAFLRDLGADEFINSDTTRFEDVIGHVDVILDLVGGEYLERSFNICGPGARYVTPAGQPSADDAAARGFFASGTYTQPTVDDLNALAGKIDEGKLRVFIAEAFPLADIGTALAHKPKQPGKVIVTL